MGFTGIYRDIEEFRDILMGLRDLWEFNGFKGFSGILMDFNGF